eukprot:312220-Lingulodinium_polyedra.AAC.1
MEFLLETGASCARVRLAAGRRVDAQQEQPWICSRSECHGAKLVDHEQTLPCQQRPFCAGVPRAHQQA